jgi:hypothetical protein
VFMKKLMRRFEICAAGAFLDKIHRLIGYKPHYCLKETCSGDRLRADAGVGHGEDLIHFAAPAVPAGCRAKVRQYLPCATWRTK